MQLLKEFKEFALKGNVVDLAVGVIIGAAFGTVVKSLVDNVLMPPLGVLIGGVDFKHLTVPLPGQDAKGDPNVMRYGAFINDCISFLIIAAAVFMMIKAMNTLKRKKEDSPTLTKSETLLTEIRDELRRATP
jgi:large conductance mechanosensitive channel